MTQTQWGWFLFVVGLLVIVTLLVGDIVTLVQSHGQIDAMFVAGVIAHVSAVALAFKGGLLIPTADAQAVSPEKRAEISKG